MARKDRARYEAEAENYKGPWKVPAGRRKKPKGAPKRPMSAFLSFSNKRRLEVMRQNPSMTQANISATLSKMWNEAEPEVKEQYVQQEIAQRQKYKVDIAEWMEKYKAEKKKEQEEREMEALKMAEESDLAATAEVRPSKKRKHAEDAEARKTKPGDIVVTLHGCNEDTKKARKRKSGYTLVTGHDGKTEPVNLKKRKADKKKSPIISDKEEKSARLPTNDARPQGDTVFSAAVDQLARQQQETIQQLSNIYARQQEFLQQQLHQILLARIVTGVDPLQQQHQQSLLQQPNNIAASTNINYLGSPNQGIDPQTNTSFQEMMFAAMVPPVSSPFNSSFVPMQSGGALSVGNIGDYQQPQQNAAMDWTDFPLVE
jgi:hypothetical protein